MWRRASLTTLTVAVLLVLSEWIAGAFAARVLHQGRIFETDPVLGWKNIPRLSTARRNPNGELWQIQINNQGFRGPDAWTPEASRRILVLGDSFAFGQGVNVQERFDAVLVRQRPAWSLVNLGIMGYGTDQEVMAGRRYYAGLQPGDALVLLTHWNDFYDVLRHSVSGRPKPWFELQEGVLTAHAPAIGWRSRIQDHSYLLARASALAERRAFSAEDWRLGLRLYQAIVSQEIKVLTARGVLVLIAYHGASMLGEPAEGEIRHMLQEVCPAGNPSKLNLDVFLDRAGGPLYFPAERHWNAKGHRIVGTALLEELDRLFARHEARGP